MNERITAAVLIILALAVVFIMFNPFGWFEPPEQPLIEVDTAQAQALAADIDIRRSVDAATAFGELFSRHPIVLMGELGAIADEPRFLADLIPMLPSMGVRHLGMEMLLAEDQNMIDELINAESFDEYLAQELFFRRLVTWGYREYVDVLRAAWAVNRSPDGPFRVLGLNVLQDYQEIATVEDFRDPAKLLGVMKNGNPDEYMAGVISREIVGRGNSALVYVTREKAFTGFILKSHSEEMNAIGMDEERQMGRILREEHGDRFATVLFHSPWPTSLTNSRAQFPVNGLMDAALDRLESTSGIRYPLFLSIEDMTEASDIVIRNTNYALGYNSEREDSPRLRFGDMTDLYIILGRIPDLEGATPIPEFIDESREAWGIANFPGSRYQDADAGDVNDFIRRFAEDRKNLLNGFAD
jgi:hypothetical protein